MPKRKKSTRATRKTTASKKTKPEEQQPSTSKEDENVDTTEDVVLPPAEEKSTPSEAASEASTEPPTENPTGSAAIIEVPSDAIVSLPENVISNEEENLTPGSPGEFVFAPIIHHSDEATSTSSSSNTVDLVNLPLSAHSCCSSASESTGDKVVSLLTSIVGRHMKKTGESSTSTNPTSNRTNPTSNRIEVIDVDELPDTPCSSVGDDVIEITPGNSNHSSRSNSPEIILNRHVVDLTGPGVVESTTSEPVGTEVDGDDGDDVFLSLWTTMHQKKKRPAPTLVPSSSTLEPSSTSATTSTNEGTENSSCQKLHCPICMDDFSMIKSDRRLMSTSCGHVFCDLCVKAAIETQKRCPTCRKKQSMKNLHPIFL